MTDPLTRLVELTVYAPIGAAAIVRERMPEVIATGREQVHQRVTLARFIGQMVVTQGRRELERRLAAAGGDQGDQGDHAAPVAAPVAAPADPGPVRSAPLGRPRSEPAPTAASLPIDDYESLAASQVVARLGGLAAAELDSVEAFERANRNRRTVLNRIVQLRTRA